MQPSLIFVHGSGDSAGIWRLQVENFGPEQAFAIDLPGHGQRPDTLPDEVTVLEYAQTVHSIITDELHLSKPIIGGHSLGGAVALSMGLEYPDELSGLILVGTGGRLRVHPDLLAGAKATPDLARTQLSQLAVAPENATVLPAKIMQEQIAPANNILYRDLAACNIFDIMPRLPELRLPVLILCGEEDRLTPVKYSQFLKQALPDSTLIIIPNAGHYVMREQPQAVNQAIQEWLETRSWGA